MTPALRQRLSELLPDSRVRFDVPLRPLTTLRIGGPADALVELGSEADVLALFAWLEREGLPVFVLGKGSNLLVADAGVRGVVVRLGRGLDGFNAASAAEPDGTRLVTAGAALANGMFVSRCEALGLGGMEFLIAVPGSIGGAIAMNAGAHQGETADFLDSVRIYEGGAGIHDVPAHKLRFAYRHSALRGQDGRLVLAGRFQLRPAEPAAIRAQVASFQTYRRNTQPRDFPNCGSVFKNPPGDFAARLIEAAGLKGHHHGAAQVSEKHANFIVNRGGATAADVLGLIDLVRARVAADYGITLELELQQLRPHDMPHGANATAAAATP
jgi:UDP-N-acetylmuramate dehydrogenase